MDNSRNSNPTVTDCTFSGNVSVSGGGMSNFDSSPTVTNCILWGDSPNEIFNDDIVEASTPTISFSDVQGGLGAGTIDGGGNIDLDPMFVDADGDDDVVGTEDDDLRLQSGSPCINAGDTDALPPDAADLDNDGDTAEPTPLDLDGHARVLCDVVDMGAYEFGIGDGDCDQDVDQDDLAAFMACVTGPGGGVLANCEAFDSDGDGDVDYADFAAIQLAFTGP